jgi:D-glycero-D-manno-heptose 1,7-bisphosphate phosphatase
VKALFLDRDGTLIVDRHYLSDPAGVTLLPGVREGLRQARAAGYALFLFSNQSGIGRGYFTLADAERVNARMESLLDLPQPIFDGVCLAPEAPDQPIVYRKPSPRFILETIAQRGLDPARCFMVGDSLVDAEAGRAAGIACVGVCTGKLDASGWAAANVPGVTIYPRLADFAATLTR